MNAINTKFQEYREYNTLVLDIIAHAQPNLSLLSKLNLIVNTSESTFKTLYGIQMPKHNNMIWVAVNELNKPYIIIQRMEPNTVSAYSVESMDEIKLANRLLNGFLVEMGYKFDEAPIVVSSIFSILILIK